MNSKIILIAFLIIAVLSTPFLSSASIKNDLDHIELKEISQQVLELKEGKISDILYGFSIDVKNWNWILEEGVLPENMNAITTFTAEGAVTTFDYNKLAKASNISVARTIIHELVHAYLLLSFQYNSVNAKQLFPGIVKAWNNQSKPDYNEIQHQEMALSFVGDIAFALQEVNERQGVVADNSIYLDLAWGGLDYQNNESLDFSDKERIQIRLVAAQLNMPEEKLKIKMSL